VSVTGSRPDQQPNPDSPTQQAVRAAAASVALLAVAVRALGRVVRLPLLAVLNLLAALVVLFEEWGWRPLAELFGYLARLKPIARLELLIAGLPPYGALLVFALPTTILLPVKLVGLWLLAKGQALVAGAMLVGAKIVSTALVARIFMLTKPALMRIGWFAWAYGRFIPWKEAIFARIRASWAWRYGRLLKTTIKLEAKKVWAHWQPWLAARTSSIRGWTRNILLSARLAGQRLWREVRSRIGAQ
jgi:hypothetical protein